MGSMSFVVDDKLTEADNDASYWLISDKDRAWTPTLGSHTVTVRGYRRRRARGQKILESSVRVTIADSRSKAPVANPGPAPAIAPLTPGTAPATAPVPARTTAPAKSPEIPMGSNPSFPMAAVPVNLPTRSPTPAPTPCVNDIVKFINKVTLSKQILSLSGTTPLDEALLQLVLSNAKPGVQLSPCNDLDTYRLTQRFAYLALVYSTGKQDEMPSWFNASDECTWKGVTCNSNQKIAELQLFSLGLKGKIPADVGLWNNLRVFAVNTNDLTGPIPLSFGGCVSVMFDLVGI
jgi:Leucine rich repeat N-terminal domain